MLKNVLVTGGAGFIGSHVVDSLIERGYSVRILDNFTPQVHPDGHIPEYLNPNAELIRGDILDRQAFALAIEGMDAVIHNASAVGVGQSMYQIEHYVQANSLGTAILLDILVNRKNRVRKVIISASMSSYGEGMYNCRSCGQVRPGLRPLEQLEQKHWEVKCPLCGNQVSPIPTPEHATQNCNSIYAISKKNQEEMVMTVCSAYDIPAVVLRYFNVYGPRQSLKNPYTGVSAIFMSRLKNGKPPIVYEDGLQTRDFVSVHDVAASNVMVLESDAVDYEVFNVGSGRPATIKEVAEKLAGLCQVDIKPHITSKYRKGDVRHCYADISKITSRIHWHPLVSLDDGFRELTKWSTEIEAVDRFAEAESELVARGLC